MTVRRTHKGGFTLVEILIVVIILGILAAIVIPQFTSASQDARRNSLTSQLQTLRSQIELYKLQHLDKMPTGLSASTTDWTQLTTKTNNAGATGTTTAHVFGPYMQAIPANPLNGYSDIKVITADPSALVGGGGAGKGFVFNSSNGKIWGTSGSTTAQANIFDEANPTSTNND
jgi:general secretion pathway protein G